MNVIDLTHLIEEGMSVYPGTEPPILDLVSTIETEKFQETKLTLFSHMGTHVDAPAHVLSGRATLEEFPPDRFVGKALVIDCTACTGTIPRDLIPAEAEQADFLLFYTGWEQHWGTPEYLERYPTLSDEALEFILEGEYQGVGFDTFGPDPVGSIRLHLKLFTKDILIIENLKHLGTCGSGLFDFACLPLKFKNADGAPARAVAIIQDERRPLL